MAKQTVYEMITERIIEKLGKGVIPWRKPWNSSNQAVSWKTQKAYRGINALMLDPGEYATFKQVNEAGGKVKKGAKGHLIVFWKWIDVEDEDTGEVKKIPFLRYYKAFEINTQCEGLKSKRKEETETICHDPIGAAETIIKGYLDGPQIAFAPGSAFYRPSTDNISVPDINDYNIKQEYYSTLFHEMVHSTGHKKRLNRPGAAQAAAFGGEIYSKEELIAEMGAAMLCGVAGIENHTIDNSASYIQSWIRALRGDSKLAVTAASAAQKAADYIQGITYNN